LLDIESFEGITGPKADRWLVKTVGALVAAIGADLAQAAREDPTRPETVILATGSAVGLGTIDAIYVAKRKISPENTNRHCSKSCMSVVQHIYTKG
jgi:hypothetical protein